MKKREFLKLLFKLEKIKLENQERELKKMREKKFKEIEEFTDKLGESKK